MPMLGWWPHRRERVGVGLFRLLLVLSGLGMAAFGLLVSLELAVHILSSRVTAQEVRLRQQC
jgi:hypothetical protein